MKKTNATLTALVALLAVSCGQSADQAAGPGVPAAQTRPTEPSDELLRLTATVSKFERSGFYRKHAPRSQQDKVAGLDVRVHRYTVADPEAEGRDVIVQLDGDPEKIDCVTVTWQGDSDAAPATWNSIKKQFMADLLESTYYDVDYGELSTYMLSRKGGHYPDATAPGDILGKVRVKAGVSGANLVIEVER